MNTALYIHLSDMYLHMPGAGVGAKNLLPRLILYKDVKVLP